MKARRITADEPDVIRAIHALFNEVWAQPQWRCDASVTEAPLEKIQGSAASKNAGLFAAFDEAGNLQGAVIARSNQVGIFAARPDRFDEATRALVDELERVMGFGSSSPIKNAALRARIAASHPRLREVGEEQRVIFE